MGKNQISVVVLHIRPKFWWMIPMGVRDNHTKYEPETQRWRPGTGFASGGPQFQKLQFRAKTSHFLGQNGPRTHSKRPNKGKVWVHSMCGFPVSTSPLRPSNSGICPGNGPKGPPQAPNFVQIGWRQPQTKNRPYLWLHGSKRNSEGTYSTRNPPLFVVSTPQNCPNGRLDPNT